MPFAMLALNVRCVAVFGLPGRSVVKEPTCNIGDTGSVPGLGRSPGGGNDNPLQYSCLGNPVDRGNWWDYSPQDCKRVGHGSATRQEQQRAITVFELGFKSCVCEGFPAC